MKKVLMAGLGAMVLFPVLALAQGVSEKSRALVDELQRQGDIEGWTFTVRPHPVLDLSLEHATGFKLSKGWKNRVHFVRAPRGATADLPSHFDWREVTEGGLPQIKDQGQCGSCWAFATNGVFESLLKIRDNKSMRLSEQYLVSCDRQYQGCSGGDWAFDMYTKPKGAVLEKDFPYVAQNTQCKRGLTYHEPLEDWAYIDANGNDIPKVEDMKAAMLAHGPLLVGVSANNPFMAYGGGILNACRSRGAVNHAVVLVGWDDDTSSWIMRNSWGKSWGEEGYMRIKWGCDQIGTGAAYANYKPTCTPQPAADAGPDVTVAAGGSVTIGTPGHAETSYSWFPATGLDDAHVATPKASPGKTTVYTMSAKTACGTAVKTVKVSVGTPAMN